jgi:hypothetical protein
MTALAVNHPAQLLYDSKGIYGIGVVGNSVEERPGKQPEIILRPDRLLEAEMRPAALQMIFGGFRHGMFSHMAEERIRREIHWEMLGRKGLNLSPPDETSRWLSGESEQEARNWNCRVYHGLRLASIAVINRLIGEALEAAAEPNALAPARRFRFHNRYEVYHATAQSRRALQLTNIFAALGLVIFGYHRSVRPNLSLIPEAKRLVEGGARLRTIARLMGFPMAFRRVKPGAAHLALAVADAFEDPRLIDAHMPETLMQMKLWLRCINLAQQVGPDFVQWTARHAVEIGGSSDEVDSILRDIADWVLACYRASVPPHIRRAILGDRDSLEAKFLEEQGEQFVHRGFNADMPLATVTKLSAEWHDAVADNMTGPDSQFPEPWCPGGRSGGFDIIPITSTAELYREGKLMHHCAGAYAGQVHSGDCYMFSVRKDGERLATVELRRGEACVEVGQLRGPCNAKAPKEVLRGVNLWLRAQRDFRFPRKRTDRLLDDDLPL